MKKRRTLRAKDVTNYAQWRAQGERLQKKLRALRDKLVRLLLRKYGCPRTTPYLLELEAGVGDLDWQAQLLGYAAKQEGLRAARKLIARLKRTAPRPKFWKLRKKVNPDFRARKRWKPAS